MRMIFFISATSNVGQLLALGQTRRWRAMHLGATQEERTPGTTAANASAGDRFFLNFVLFRFVLNKIEKKRPKRVTRVREQCAPLGSNESLIE